MLRFKPQSLVFLSGLPFFMAGFMLVRKGLGFLNESTKILTHLPETSLPLVRLINSFWSDLSTLTLWLVVPALLVGLLKGRKVIVPSVQQNLDRLLNLSEDAPLTAVFDRKRWIILAVMMGFGILLNNILPVPSDIRGFFDVAIGVGLLQGGIASLRTFRTLKRA